MALFDGGGGQVSVPVNLRLEVLQSSLAKLQNQLDKLSPNSKRFKELQSIITSITHEMDKMTLQTAKPFGDQSQFLQTEKSIDNIEESFRKVELIINKIHFSDLKLDPSQQAELKSLSDEITRIKEQFDSFKQQKKADLLGDVNFAEFKKLLNSTDLNSTFDGLLKIIDKKRNEIINKYENLQREIETQNTKIQKGLTAEKIQQNGFVDNSTNEIFDEFKQFLSLNNGVLEFKAGQENAFYQYLQSQFSLNDGQIQSIKNLTIQEVERLFKETDGILSNTINAGNEAAAKKANLEQKQTDLAKNYQAAQDAGQSLARVQDEVQDASINAAGAISQVNERIATYKEQAVQGAQNTQQMALAQQEVTIATEQFRRTLAGANAELLKQQQKMNTFNGIKNAIVNFMGFNQILNLTRNAVRNALNHIRELDKTMNAIAVVTNMTTADLWKQVDAYTAIAQKYGVTIQGAYEVSKIYYQAGYDTNEVLTLTNETLKLSKIAGLDYATTTDYMMTAMRGFKLEMEDASRVVDVYSNLAANTAVSQAELAEAMTRTASSMESVGASFEESSAMIATMVAVTRESANNIGSALKSIASRYGELKKGQQDLVDEDGEIIDYNKVDTALKSVGITLKDTNGEFRNFTDVIIELAGKWDTLNSVQQRYIATQFAGNRQQSRFLALVSNIDLLQENIKNAENAEGVGDIQAATTLEGLEAKINQVNVALQEFYTTLGIESGWKILLDSARNVLNTLNEMPKLFGKIPAAAIVVVMNIINLVKGALLKGVQSLATIWMQALNNAKKDTEISAQEQQKAGENWINNFITGIKSGAANMKNVISTIKRDAAEAFNTKNFNNAQGALYNAQTAETNFKTGFNGGSLLTAAENQFAKLGQYQAGKKGSSFKADSQQLIGEYNALVSVCEQYGITVNKNVTTLRELKSSYQELIPQLKNKESELHNVTLAAEEAAQKEELLAKAQQKIARQKFAMNLQQIASGLSTIALLFNDGSRSGEKFSGVLQAIAGAIYVVTAAWSTNPIGAAITGLTFLITGLSTIIETTAEKIERLTEEAEELKQKATQAKSDQKTLENASKKYEELKQKRYESAEAAEEYQEYVEDLADKFPALISGFDEAGNVMIETTNLEHLLAEARKNTADATYQAAKKESELAKEQLKEAEKKAKIKPVQSFSEDLADNLGISVQEFENKTPLEQALTGIARYSSTNEDIDDFFDGIKTVQDFLSAIDKIKAANNVSEEAKAYVESLRILFTQSGETVDKNFNILNEAIEEFNSSETLEDSVNAYNKIKVASNKLRENGLGNTLDSVYGKYFEALDEWATKYRDYLLKQEIFSSKIMSEANAWLEKEEKKFDNNDVKNIFLRSIQELSDGQTFSEWAETNEKEAESLYKIYNDWWKNLGQENQNLVSEMLKHSELYDFNDISPYLENADNKIIVGFQNRFQEISENISARIQQSFISRNLSIDFIKGKNFTSVDENFIQGQLKQYDRLIELGLANEANNLITIIEKLYNSEEDGLSSEIRKILSDADLSNKESVEEILSNLPDDVNPAIKDFLNYLKDNLLENVALQVQIAKEGLKENFEKDSKDFKNAISGMSLFDMQEFLTKNSIEFNDENVVKIGDQFVLTSNAANDYYEKLINESYSLNDSIRKASDQLKKIDYSSLDNFNKSIGNIDENIKKVFYVFYGINFNEILEDGKIDEIEWENIQTALQSFAESSEELNLLTTKSAEELKYIAAKQKKDRITSAISDYLSGDFIPEKLAENYADLNIDFTEKNATAFVEKYTEGLDLTIKELNEYAAKAIEKNRQTDIVDAIKSFNVYSDKVAYASLDTVLALANATRKNISELITGNIDSQNNFEINLDVIKEYEPLIEQAIADLYDSLYTSINNIISWSIGGYSKGMTANDAKILQEDLSKIGLDNIKLQFVEMADGLRITKQSLYDIYNGLKEIGNMQSSIMLKDLVAELVPETRSVADINKEILKLQQQQNDATDKQNKTLKTQIEILQEAARERVLNENSTWNFLNTDVLGAQMNAINFGDEISKAYGLVDTAIKNNYMTTKDYMQLLTTFSKTATKDNPISFMGQTLTGAAGEITEAIQRLQGVHALVKDITGKGFVIDFKALNSSFDIGAEGLRNSIDNYSDAMIDSAIKIVQAEIDFVRPFAEMEKMALELQSMEDEGITGFLNSQIEGISDSGNELHKILQTVATATGMDINELIKEFTDDAIFTSQQRAKFLKAWSELDFDYNNPSANKDILQNLWNNRGELPEEVLKNKLEIQGEVSEDTPSPLKEIINGTATQMQAELAITSASSIKELNDLLEAIKKSGFTQDVQDELSKAIDAKKQELETLYAEKESGILTQLETARAEADKATVDLNEARGALTEAALNLTIAKARVNALEQQLAQKEAELVSLGEDEDTKREEILATIADLEGQLSEAQKNQVAAQAAYDEAVKSVNDAAQVLSDKIQELKTVKQMASEAGVLTSDIESKLNDTLSKVVEAATLAQQTITDDGIKALTAANSVTLATIQILNNLLEKFAAIQNGSNSSGGQEDTASQETGGKQTRHSPHIGPITMMRVNDDKESEEAAKKAAERARQRAIEKSASLSEENDRIAEEEMALRKEAEEKAAAEAALQAEAEEAARRAKAAADAAEAAGKAAAAEAKAKAEASKQKTTTIQQMYDTSLQSDNTQTVNTIEVAKGLAKNIELEQQVLEDFTKQWNRQQLYNDYKNATSDAQRYNLIETGAQIASKALNVSQDAARIFMKHFYEELEAEFDTSNGPTKPKTQTQVPAVIEEEVTVIDEATIKRQEEIDKLAQLLSTNENLRTSAEQLINSYSDQTRSADAVQSGLNSFNSEMGTSISSLDILSAALQKAAEAANSITFGGAGSAKGNVALAKGTKTLMGELGPELYVTGGRYYVAGQNGAEFVNLPSDAIVFNHLQTKKLLENGSTGRGRAVTNERNATSYAKGNARGPAKASASEVLNFLEGYKALLEGLKGASAKDLANAGGGGGGDEKQLKNVTAEIQRWYNLLRQIDKLEKDINYQESLRSKIQSDRIVNGRAIYDTYKKEISYLDQEITRNKELANLQKSWYDRKREELANSAYGKIFTYDENGLQQYVGDSTPGSGLGLDILENLTKKDVTGQATGAAENVKTQLEYLKSVGFDIESLKYNKDGTIIDTKKLKGEKLDEAYVQMMQNFWDSVDGWRDELDSIYDSYHDQLETVLDNEEKRNGLLQEIIDNQLSVEQSVMKALEEREQAAIDKAQDERDAISDAAEKFLDGLSEQLDREQKMYQQNETDTETDKLRRQLAILQRSGGSASQIRSLENEIRSRDQDAYFQAQQDQIDAIKEASDKQIEKMDHQIDIMTETLEYQKEHGLLWNEVYQIMAQTPEQIQQFIMENTPDFESNSALQVAEDLRKLKGEIELWISSRDDSDNPIYTDVGHNWNSYLEASQNRYKNILTDDLIAQAKTIFDSEYVKSADPNAAGAAADAFLNQKLDEYNKAHAQTTANAATTATATGSDGNGKKQYWNIRFADGNHAGKRFNSQKEAQAWLDKQKKTMGDNLSMAYRVGIQDKIIKAEEEKLKWLGAKVFAYKHGGLADYTGLAMVHGSKTRPEAFFNAEQTEMWKKDILGKNNSLTSLLLDFTDALNGMANESTYGTINHNGSVVIEHAEVNMNVDEISNDYDARRAGASALEEMLNIARKSGTRGVSRG